MKILWASLGLVGLLGATIPASAVDGMILVRSAHPPQATMDRLEEAVQAQGMKVFARIDHAAGAAKIGKTLRATELLIFGNPQGGTPLMECAQTAGIDLPLKALVWEDAAGGVWLGYNDPTFLAQRHAVAACPVVEKMQKALAGFAAAAAGP